VITVEETLCGADNPCTVFASLADKARHPLIIDRFVVTVTDPACDNAGHGHTAIPLRCLFVAESAGWQ